MATVNPVISSLSSTPRIVWAGMVTGDTLNSYTVCARCGLAMSVQISGTFGGATVKLQQSNDGTTWFDIKDITGTTISATADAIFEASVSALYVRPTISGGAANNINVILMLRGV